MFRYKQSPILHLLGLSVEIGRLVGAWSYADRDDGEELTKVEECLTRMLVACEEIRENAQQARGGTNERQS